MKPYPLASLNHLTVPVAICVFSLQKEIKADFCLGSRYYRKHSLTGTRERKHVRQTPVQQTLGAKQRLFTLPASGSSRVAAKKRLALENFVVIIKH
jgi:hypothetical protein